MATEQIWIAVLHISQRTAEKLQGRHEVDPLEIHDAIVCVADITGSKLWDDHHHCWKVLIKLVDARKRRLLVVIFPVEDAPDEWNLGSAYPV